MSEASITTRYLKIRLVLAPYIAIPVISDTCPFLLLYMFGFEIMVIGCFKHGLGFQTTEDQTLVGAESRPSSFAGFSLVIRPMCSTCSHVPPSRSSDAHWGLAAARTIGRNGLAKWKLQDVCLGCT